MLELLKKWISSLDPGNQAARPSEEFDISPEELNEHHATLQTWKGRPVDVQSVNWVIPKFEHVLYGGIYTIFRFADYFRKKGIKNRFIVCGDVHLKEKDVRKSVASAFNLLSEDSEFFIYKGDVRSIPECDAVIATMWTTAFIVLRFNQTKKKFYFVQDFEPLFYSSGPQIALAEATYRFGLKGLVNTPGLRDLLVSRYQMECASFIPCADPSIYAISKEEVDEKMKHDTLNIVMYGRPNHPRNAFELSLSAMKQLKEKHGDRIHIYSVGAEWKERDYQVERIVKNLGRLNSARDLADLYKKSDIGLVLMFTAHPSYQPFEYMSCGCAVLTNRNIYNDWFFRHDENAVLVEPTPDLIVEGIEKLMRDAVLRKKIVLTGMEDVRKNNWDNECDKIYKEIKGAL